MKLRDHTDVLALFGVLLALGLGEFSRADTPPPETKRCFLVSYSNSSDATTHYFSNLVMGTTKNREPTYEEANAAVDKALNPKASTFFGPSKFAIIAISSISCSDH